MTIPRKRIARDVEARVLIKSCRRCCLCLFWDKDTKQKEGQLAHIDRDPSNGLEDNLVYLCLKHHNQYDARETQSKNISPTELRHARTNLYQKMNCAGDATFTVTLKLDRSFETFSNADQEELLLFVKEVLRKRGNVKVKHLRPGSVLITLQLLERETECLFEAIEAGAFGKLGVVDAWIDDVEKGTQTRTCEQGRLNMAIELAAFQWASDWIPKLCHRIGAIREQRHQEIEVLNDLLHFDPLVLAKYYVEPACQEVNPADREDLDRLTVRENVMSVLNRFLEDTFLGDPGGNQMFILSDAGMGKTAFLVMLKLLHMTAFWPKDTGCILRKLDSRSLSDIASIPSPSETILLLDALDEDPSGYGRIEDRLFEILQMTRKFKRVVLTCRTQFFPLAGADHLERPGRLCVGGFSCPTKYLSIFDDNRVQAYLAKRFPKRFGLFPRHVQLEEARKVVERMGSLHCRPMLLAYIEDLMEGEHSRGITSEYQVYKSLVGAWLCREEAKAGIPAKMFLRGCELLATEMQATGVRSVTPSQLDAFVNEISLDIGVVKNLDFKGRSLLNKSSTGDYRFSHYSIQEFLVARRILEGEGATLSGRLRLTDFIFRLISLENKAETLSGFDLTSEQRERLAERKEKLQSAEAERMSRERERQHRLTAYEASKMEEKKKELDFVSDVVQKLGTPEKWWQPPHG